MQNLETLEKIYNNLDVSLRAVLQVENGREWKEEYVKAYQLTLEEPKNQLLYQNMKQLRYLEPTSQSPRLKGLHKMSPGLAMAKIQSYCLINYGVTVRLDRRALTDIIFERSKLEELIDKEKFYGIRRKSTASERSD